MKKLAFFTIFGSFFLFISCLLSHFETEDFVIKGIVLCNGEPCPKVLVKLSSPTLIRPLGRDTDDEGKFSIDYTGKVGDRLKFEFFKEKFNSLPCNASPIFFDVTAKPFFSFLPWVNEALRLPSPVKMNCSETVVLPVKGN